MDFRLLSIIFPCPMADRLEMAVWVPPPQNNHFVGMIISRDSTTAFVLYYSSAKSKNLSLWWEDLFNSNAMPDWIYRRIEYYNRKYMDK